MRALVIAMVSALGACSFFIPPSAWHPAIDADDPELELTCPPTLWPIFDGAVAAVGLSIATLLIVRDEHAGPATLGADLTSAYARGATLVSLPWLGGAIYGAVHASKCAAERRAVERRWSEQRGGVLPERRCLPRIDLAVPPVPDAQQRGTWP